MLLEHVKNVNFVDEELETEFAELTSMMEQLNEELGMTAPGSDIRMPEPGKADAELGTPEFSEPEDMVSAMEVVIKQMNAAKKAMHILNKMPDSESRTRNRSRVMGNLNRIRGSLTRVFKKMQAMSDSGDYEHNLAY